MNRLLVGLAVLSGCGLGVKVESEAVPLPPPVLISSLTLSPVALTPEFSRDVADYSAVFPESAELAELDVGLAPGAELRINGKPATAKTRLFVPLSGLVLELRATLNDRSDERYLTLRREGFLRQAPSFAPMKIPAPIPEQEGARGYSTPLLSGNGAFAAVSFMDELTKIHSVEVFKLNGTSLERVAFLEEGLWPVAFCETSECLWAEDNRFGPNGENRFELWRLTWNAAGVVKTEKWVVPADTYVSLAATDTPAEVLEYSPTGVATRRLLPNGAFGPRSTVPTLRWGAQMAGFDLSADRKVLVHGDPHSFGTAGATQTPGGPRPAGQLVTFTREVDTGAWVERNRFDSPTSDEESYGRSLLLARDGSVLLAGVPVAEVNGLEKAGLVQRFDRTPNGDFQFTKNIVSPDPEAFGFFGGFLAGRVSQRVVTFTGSQPWRSWFIAKDGTVTPGPQFPTTLGGMRLSQTLDVAIGIRMNESTQLRELEVWR